MLKMRRLERLDVMRLINKRVYITLLENKDYSNNSEYVHSHYIFGMFHGRATRSCKDMQDSLNRTELLKDKILNY